MLARVKIFLPNVFRTFNVIIACFDTLGQNRNFECEPSHLQCAKRPLQPLIHRNILFFYTCMQNPHLRIQKKSMGAAAILPLTKRNNTEKKTLIASAAYDISNSYTLQPVILIR